MLEDSKAIAQFIRKAVEGEDIVLKSEGNQLYSYTYVVDAATAALYLLLKGLYTFTNCFGISIRKVGSVPAANNNAIFILPLKDCGGQIDGGVLSKGYYRHS